MISLCFTHLRAPVRDTRGTGDKCDGEAYTGAATTRIWSTAWNNVDARDLVTATQHPCIQGPYRAVGITRHYYCWYILSNQMLVKSMKTLLHICIFPKWKSSRSAQLSSLANLLISLKIFNFNKMFTNIHVSAGHWVILHTSSAPPTCVYTPLQPLLLQPGHLF